LRRRGSGGKSRQLERRREKNLLRIKKKDENLNLDQEGGRKELSPKGEKKICFTRE